MTPPVHIFVEPPQLLRTEWLFWLSWHLKPPLQGTAEKLENLRSFIAMGADVNKDKTSYGDTPLMFASEEGHEEVVQVLLQARDHVDDEDSEGYTVLMVAASCGHNEVVRILLQSGANINKTDGEKQSALHYASYDGQLETLRALLEAGADKDLKDVMGQIPLIWARQEGHKEVVALLLSYRAPSAASKKKMKKKEKKDRQKAKKARDEAGGDGKERQPEKFPEQVEPGPGESGGDAQPVRLGNTGEHWGTLIWILKHSIGFSAGPTVWWTFTGAVGQRRSPSSKRELKFHQKKISWGRSVSPMTASPSSSKISSSSPLMGATRLLKTRKSERKLSRKKLRNL